MQWLMINLNYVPKVAWLTNTVSHSATTPYLLSESGIGHMIFTNLHYTWEEWLAEHQYSDFIWIQNFQNNNKFVRYLNESLKRIHKHRFQINSVLSHYLPFNSAEFESCGPNAFICADFDFANESRQNLHIHPYNIKKKAELLLEQYSKTGTLSRHNVVIAPIGRSMSYEAQIEFDYQYNNYQRLIEFINTNQDIYKATLEFGVPSSYFTNILEKHTIYPTLKGDFLNYADIENAYPVYKTGYFTYRPGYKVLLRRIMSILRTTEILFSFAMNLNVFRQVNVSYMFSLVIQARESVARLMDYHSIAGTLTKNALEYAYNEIARTFKNCLYVQEYSINFLTSNNIKYVKNEYIHKYVYRDGQVVSALRTIMPNDSLYLFNSLSYERMEIVELRSKIANLRILDHINNEIVIQVNPLWTLNPHNRIIISTSMFKIFFAVVIPPMSIKLLRIKEDFNFTLHTVLHCLKCSLGDTESISSTPFLIQPIKSGDIQVENYKLRLIFDQDTGLLKTLIDKTTGIRKNITIIYSAFKNLHRTSDNFLTNSSILFYDFLRPYFLGIHAKNILIAIGDICTEIIIMYGQQLEHSTKIFNLLDSPLSKALLIESKINFELFPTNKDLDVFMSIQTDIENGYHPEIIIDSNGFQFSRKKLNISRTIESNIYPFTSTVYIQDRSNRVSILTDHAQGVTATQEGEITVFLDKNVLYNGQDNIKELAERVNTYNRHFLILENIYTNSNLINNNNLLLPSFASLYLSNSLNYELDIYLINKNSTLVARRHVRSLTKSPLPCDITLLNFRILLKNNIKQLSSSSLLIFQRHSYSCDIDIFTYPRCRDQRKILLKNLIYNYKEAYTTLLGGNNKGNRIHEIDFDSIPAAGLKTIRVHF